MRLTYIALFAFSLFASVTLQAQESPYFVTYDHHLEEPGIWKSRLPAPWVSRAQGSIGSLRLTWNWNTASLGVGLRSYTWKGSLLLVTAPSSPDGESRIGFVPLRASIG